MDKSETLKRELEEHRRQLRSVDVEIERLKQQVPSLEEKIRLTEQKNIQDQTKLGVDPLDIQPSKEVRIAAKSLEENAKVLEKFETKRAEIRSCMEGVEVSLIEDELIQQSRLFTKLKERESALEDELKILRKELETVEKRKGEIALRVAERTADKG